MNLIYDRGEVKTLKVFKNYTGVAAQNIFKEFIKNNPLNGINEYEMIEVLDNCSNKKIKTSLIRSVVLEYSHLFTDTDFLFNFLIERFNFLFESYSITSWTKILHGDKLSQERKDILSQKMLNTFRPHMTYYINTFVDVLGLQPVKEFFYAELIKYTELQHHNKIREMLLIMKNNSSVAIDLGEYYHKYRLKLLNPNDDNSYYYNYFKSVLTEEDKYNNYHYILNQKNTGMEYIKKTFIDDSKIPIDFLIKELTVYLTNGQISVPQDFLDQLSAYEVLKVMVRE